MSRAHSAISLLALGILVLPLATRNVRGGDPPGGKKSAGKRADRPAVDATKLSDKELKTRWTGLLVRRQEIMQALEQLQEDFQTAKGIPEKQKIQARRSEEH